MHRIDWHNIDKSGWGKRRDPEIAAELGVTADVIAYWRKKFEIPSYDEYFLQERDRQNANGFAWCSTCKQFLSAGMFGKHKKGHYGLKAQCTTCRTVEYRATSHITGQRRRDYYKENRDAVLEYNRKHHNPVRAKIYGKVRNTQLKEPYVALAGGKCQRCGYDEFLSGLEFHHVDPSQKDTHPVKVINSGNTERAMSELDKCALLCRNCHQTYHASEWAAEFVKRDGLGWTLASQ